MKTGISRYGVSKVTVTGHSLGQFQRSVWSRCSLLSLLIDPFSGAAISLLDAVYLPLQIPSISIRAVLYGLPRVFSFTHRLLKTPLITLIQVGNQAFADYIDAHVTSLTRINNKKDPIAIVPGRSLGFHHPSGEVHINSSSAWVACAGKQFAVRQYVYRLLTEHRRLPGQDNTNSQCEVGAVPNILVSNIIDHLGPYDGVWMGC